MDEKSDSEFGSGVQIVNCDLSCGIDLKGDSDDVIIGIFLETVACGGHVDIDGLSVVVNLSISIISQTLNGD